MARGSYFRAGYSGADNNAQWRNDPNCCPPTAEATRNACGSGSPPGCRRWPLLLPRITVLAGDSGTLTTTSQADFIGRRVSLVESVPGSFLVNGISAGTRLQQASTTANVDAAHFAPGAYGSEFDMDPIGGGIAFAVAVTNTSGATATISGVIFGDSAA